MTSLELKEQLLQLHPSLSVEEGAEWLQVNVEAVDWIGLADTLRNNPLLSFDFLFCVTCVDRKTHLSMVYNHRSMTQ